MKKNPVWIALLVVALAAAVAACGGSSDEETSCTVNGDCEDGEVCNPYTLACEKACVAGATDETGCPSGETCEANATVCACTPKAAGATDSCTTALGAGNACNPEKHKCETTCESDDGCVEPLKCDPYTHTCVNTPAADCTLTPCGYGDFCLADKVCHPVAEFGTCERAAGRDASRPFNVAAGTAPLLANFHVVESGQITCADGTTDPCGGAGGVVFTVDYTDPDGDFPTSGLYSTIWYVTSGADTNTACPIERTSDSTGSAGTLTLRVCTAPSIPDPAVYVTDGAGNFSNTLCGTWE